MSASAKIISEAEKRRTFAIISHPDAGKTTLTEKLLLLGNAIQVAGEVKGRRADRHATSDWMEMEQQRGISVTTSVMQFPYRDRIVNLLDTPGHADFSEDTYRTLTAVDSALMVIDVAKGVEQRTIKLMEVCRLRTTPIFTFINKLDREGRDPIDLMDEVEEVLKIRCTPMTWPIGMGSRLKGIYHLHTDEITMYEPKKDGRLHEGRRIKGLDSDEARAELGDMLEEFREELELVQGASHEWDLQAYLRGELTPVYFGTALNTFGIAELMTDFVEYAPAPQNRTMEQDGESHEISYKAKEFTGFVFKIQANMDPKHRDRVAFMRICSGKFEPGMKLRHVRLKKDVKIADALTFFSSDRGSTVEAFPGDIIGLHNHGTINIGDSFSEGTPLQFTGIPNFAPELFRRAVLKDPLKMKALLKGLEQLCEEGATQLFKPMRSNELILGAVGPLQFEVVAHRLKHEYKVECLFEGVQVATARWVSCDDEKTFEQFKRKAHEYLAIDHGNALVYVAPTRVNLSLAQERHPDVRFHETREHSMTV